ncbi:DUF6473 family protein [Roseibacterium sp. SDUM158017]|uniref:DUF6473 family protein n=1 Tax=Roseicyclus salinarum TaxID=3036773 RepID=UPI0024157B55|nr:DUF6473 family protein [Roseibacterium sp. SDUM158017]MDG4649058.1 DUF6473 family protein [Roseibacterium sp. SDUM158017]
MSFEKGRAMPLDYQPVTYPGSVLRFRGPLADLSKPHVLCLGGTETFGRFLPAPYPALLAGRLGDAVTNMGVASAGFDVILRDPAISAAARTARAIVLQVPCAANMTNRFYAVHPRRNDRFVKAGAMLRTIYRDVDFTEFHFTRHLLDHLKTMSPDRFAILRDELQAAWRARMRAFLAEAPAPVHLLWISRRTPDTAEPEKGLGADPLFVTRAMLEDAAADAASLSIVTDPRGGAARPATGMFFAPREEAAAGVLPGPGAHGAACAELVPRLGGAGATSARSGSA